MCFIKYTLFAEKMFLYGKKSFVLKIFFTEKIFYREKYSVNQNVKNMSRLRNILLCIK